MGERGFNSSELAPLSEAKTERQLREAMAARLHVAGKTEAEIGAELGVTPRAARIMVNRALERFARRHTDRLARLMGEEDVLLLSVREALLPAALAGQVDAAREVRAISESRRKLWGADRKPPDVHVTGPTIIVGGEVFGVPPETIDGEATEVPLLEGPEARKSPHPTGASDEG